MSSELATEEEEPTLPVKPPPELQKLERSDPKTFKAVSQYVMQVAVHSGPLPSPQQLAEYEQASPGLANRIVGMAEAEQATRHHCMRSEVDAIKRGQVCALSAFALAMGAACYLGAVGIGAAAGTVGATAITVFGGAFILARHFGSKQEQPEGRRQAPAKKPRSKH